MTKKLPKDLIPGDASDESVVHASDYTVGFSRGHKEGDISRLQSAAHNFVSTVQYKIDDLVIYDNKLYRNTTINTPDNTFDILQWELISDSTSGVEKISELVIDVDKNWQGKIITNHGNPVNSKDVSNKQYVDKKKITVPVFDSAVQYNPGEIIVYSPQHPNIAYKLYRNITQTTIGNGWTPAQWDALSIHDLNDLTDVNIGTGNSAPTDGQVVTFDSATQTWINKDLPADDAESLEGLTDTEITTPVDDQILTREGTKWVNKTPVTAPETLKNLTDTEITTPVKDQSLVRNETNDKWINEKISNKHIVDNANIEVNKLLKGTDGKILKSTSTGVEWGTDLSTAELFLPYDKTVQYEIGQGAKWNGIIYQTANEIIPANENYDASKWTPINVHQTQLSSDVQIRHVTTPELRYRTSDDNSHKIEYRFDVGSYVGVVNDYIRFTLGTATIFGIITYISNNSIDVVFSNNYDFTFMGTTTNIRGTLVNEIILDEEIKGVILNDKNHLGVDYHATPISFTPAGNLRFSAVSLGKTFDFTSVTKYAEYNPNRIGVYSNGSYSVGGGYISSLLTSNGITQFSQLQLDDNYTINDSIVELPLSPPLLYNDLAPKSFKITNNGEKVYVSYAGYVIRYNLNIPYYLSSVNLENSFVVSVLENNGLNANTYFEDMVFSSRGSYILPGDFLATPISGDTAALFALTNEKVLFHITVAILQPGSTQIHTSLGVLPQDNDMKYIYLTEDQNTLFAYGAENNMIYQYSISYDADHIPSITYVGNSGTLPTDATTVSGFSLSSSGQELLILDADGSHIGYTLPNPLTQDKQIVVSRKSPNVLSVINYNLPKYPVSYEDHLPLVIISKREIPYTSFSNPYYIGIDEIHSREDINIQYNRLKHLQEPQYEDDATTKKYVDSTVGSKSLVGLSDVTISNVEKGQVIKRNEANNAWINTLPTDENSLLQDYNPLQSYKKGEQALFFKIIPLVAINDVPAGPYNEALWASSAYKYTQFLGNNSMAHVDVPISIAIDTDTIVVPDASFFNVGDFIETKGQVGRVTKVSNNIVSINFPNIVDIPITNLTLLNYIENKNIIYGAIINYKDYADGYFHITFTSLPANTPLYIAPADLVGEDELEKDIFIDRNSPNTLQSQIRDTKKNFITYQDNLFLATTFRTTKDEFSELTNKYWFNITPQTAIPLNAIGNHISNVADGVESDDAATVSQVYTISADQSLKHNLISEYSESVPYTIGTQARFGKIIQTANVSIPENTAYNATQWDPPIDIQQSGFTETPAIQLWRYNLNYHDGIGFSIASGSFWTAYLQIASGEHFEKFVIGEYYIIHPGVGTEITAKYRGFGGGSDENHQLFDFEIKPNSSSGWTQGTSITKITHATKHIEINSNLKGGFVSEDSTKFNLEPFNISKTSTGVTVDKFNSGVDGWEKYDEQYSPGLHYGQVVASHSAEHGGSLFVDLTSKEHSYYYYGGVQKVIPGGTWDTIDFDYRVQGTPQWNGVYEEVQTELLCRIFSGSTLVKEVEIFKDNKSVDSGWLHDTVDLDGLSGDLRFTIVFKDFRWLDARHKLYLDNVKITKKTGSNILPFDGTPNFFKRLIVTSPDSYSLVDILDNRDDIGDGLYIATISSRINPNLVDGDVIYEPVLETNNLFRDLQDHKENIFLGNNTSLSFDITNSSHKKYFSTLSGSKPSNDIVINRLSKKINLKEIKLRSEASDANNAVKSSKGVLKILNRNKDTQYKQNEDIPLVVANNNPTGITYGNGKSYVVDGTANKIYTYNTATKLPISNEDIPLVVANNNPTGITYDDGKLHVVDSTTHKIYVYDIATKLPISSEDIPLFTGNINPTGITHGNGKSYVVDNNYNKIYVYDDTTKKRLQDEDIALDVKNTNSTGITYDNGKLHVVDGTTYKIYVYDIATKKLQQHGDITLNSTNSNPVGVTYDDGKSYVVDGTTHKIYVYDLTILKVAFWLHTLWTIQNIPVNKIFLESDQIIIVVEFPHDGNTGDYLVEMQLELISRRLGV